MKPPVILTVGHSTRSLEEFLELLHVHGVELLADVRTFAGSRRYPHFGSEALARSLPESRIGYRHLKLLGGRRSPRADSVNRGWRNEGFRGYADYMATAEFARGLEELMTLGAERRTCIMCAEAVPWRCHRNLIADALVAGHGVPVRHILSREKEQLHRPTDFLRVEDGVLTYPPEAHSGQTEMDLV